MDYSLSKLLQDNMPTKQKIMICALSQFCSKGYAETTIRDIAAAVGITPGAIYSHYSSKEQLLNYMLKDYAEYTSGLFHRVDIESILKEKPTGEGITICIMSSVSILTEDAYYANLVHLIHQEQHRNELFGGFVLLRLSDTMEFVDRILNTLQEMNIIRAGYNAAYWGAITYSVFHTITTCSAISTAKKVPSFKVVDIGPMLRYMFDTMLDAYKQTLPE